MKYVALVLEDNEDPIRPSKWTKLFEEISSAIDNIGDKTTGCWQNIPGTWRGIIWTFQIQDDAEADLKSWISSVLFEYSVSHVQWIEMKRAEELAAKMGPR